MIAALPMYDRPETRAANGRLWAAIRNALPYPPAEAPPLPEALSHPDDLMAHWLAPDLAFSQTCGMPYRTRLHPHVALIGTPDYGLPGCPPGYYNSVLVIRAEDDRDDPALWSEMRLACNDPGSQSGWAAAQTHLAGRGTAFQRVLLTGAHRNSAEAVAEGHADIASIDAQTWRMISRWDGVAVQLREAARTGPTPGLPYICAGGRDPDPLRGAVRSAIAALSPEDRAILDLQALTLHPAELYRAVPTPPFPAADASKNG